MQIDDRFRTNCVFIGVRDENGHFTPKGTGFFASVSAKIGHFCYLVTAEHVVSGLTAAGHEKIWVRVNNDAGAASYVLTTPRDWIFHPNAERDPTDVAIVPVGFPDGAVFYAVDTSMFLTPDLFTKHEYGLGDEIVVIGLFTGHVGKGRNIPLVRIGSIAALPEEPVFTKYAGYIDAYLVELHSIGGLSGSPVYAHRPPLRIKDGTIENAQGHRMQLLGLMHGHFDAKNISGDSAVDDAEGSDRINTGVGVVIPAYKILETINHPDLVRDRAKVIEMEEKNGASPDLGATPPAPAAPARPPIEGDAQHKERFTDLLDAAVGKPKQAG